jgi:hypothetical protein
MNKIAALLVLCVVGCVPPGLQAPVIAQMYDGPPRPLDRIALFALYRTFPEA